MDNVAPQPNARAVHGTPNPRLAITTIYDHPPSSADNNQAHQNDGPQVADRQQFEYVRSYDVPDSTDDLFDMFPGRINLRWPKPSVM